MEISIDTTSFICLLAFVTIIVLAFTNKIAASDVATILKSLINLIK